MIEIRNVKTINGKRIDHFIESPEKIVIDAKNLLLFPAVIDPHVHFRVPGHEHKEDWKTGALSAIYGGVSTVFDMPNNNPPCSTMERLREKKMLIEAQLKAAGIPLRYYLYFGVEKNHLHEIEKVKDEVIGLKVFMGSSTGSLLIDDDETLDAVFKIAAKCDLIVAVHAEDEKLLQQRKQELGSSQDPAVHSKIRYPDAAAAAIKKAISLTKKHKTKLYILHVSSEKELALIRKAKQDGLPIYAEATPHHLFLTDAIYPVLGNKAVVNPPLRTEEDRLALWRALDEGTIDTIGSDHAPHTLEEKKLPYGKAPSGVPGVETLLPLLFTAFHQNRLTLEKIAELTSSRIAEIFGLPPNDDVILVDLDMQKTVMDENMHTKVQWSPFSGKTLKGWPVYTIFKKKVFKLEH